MYIPKFCIFYYKSTFFSCSLCYLIAFCIINFYYSVVFTCCFYCIIYFCICTNDTMIYCEISNLFFW